MPLLRIQHLVPDFDGWKLAFENDPMDRRGSGVRRYEVHRAVAEPNLVMIDLEFATLSEAEAFQLRLHDLWAGPGGAVTRDPNAWILESVVSDSLL